MSELYIAAEMPQKTTKFRKSNPPFLHPRAIDFISISTPNAIELIL